MTEKEKRSDIAWRHLQHNVLQGGLCCGCGACVAVCPTEALTIDISTSYEPAINEDKCISCGLCYQVCPGKGYPVVEWAEQHCDDKTSMVLEHGPVRHYWIGHSTNPDIRAGAASGGIATSLLLYLLDSGWVEDVGVIVMENGRPTARLTHDPEVVRSAMMSKYGPVPSMAEIIPALRRRPRRVALTVTPCQLAGLKLATERVPKLRESEIITLGLFCGQIQTYEALTAIAATLGVSYPGEAKLVAWRCGEYPGSIRFEKDDGTFADKPLYSWLDVAVPHFSLNRCFLCPDCGNWLADMTLGDNHQGLTNDTLIVCRTKRGENILEAAKQSGAVAYDPLPEERIANDPVLKGLTRHKLFPAIVRNAWLKQTGQTAPEFDYDANLLLRGKLKLGARLWIWKYRLTFWARTGWRRRFLLRHPWLLEKTGHFLYYFPSTIPGFTLMNRIINSLVNLLRQEEA